MEISRLLAAEATSGPSPSASATSAFMDRPGVDGAPAAAKTLADLDAPQAGGSVAPAFGQVLSGFLRQVDDSQHRADAMVESFAVGEPVDVHHLMLSLNEASNALQLTLSVRSKVLEAYQELMRLPL